MGFTTVGRVMFIEEATSEYNHSLARKKMRVRLCKELCKKNLKPSFKLGGPMLGILHVYQKETAHD